MSLETHQNNHCKNIFLIFERLRITFAIRKSTLKLSFLSYCYVKLDLLCAAKTHQPLISDVLHNPPKNLTWLLGAVQGCNPSCSSKMHLPSSTDSQHPISYCSPEIPNTSVPQISLSAHCWSKISQSERPGMFLPVGFC